MQFTQHIIRDGRCGLGFPIEENRHVRIGTSHLMHKCAQFRNGFVFFAGIGKIIVIKTHNESRSAACLTSKTREIRKSRNSTDLLPLRFDGLCKVADAKTGNVFRMVILVNDDDREVVFHSWKRKGRNLPLGTTSGRRLLLMNKGAKYEKHGCFAGSASISVTG